MDQEEVKASGCHDAEPETAEEKARRGHELFEKLKNLVSSRNRDAFALGAILKDIRDQQIYEALGYGSFPEFCADPDIAFRKTSAYGFISLHETFVLTYKIDFQILGKIPYSKLLIVEPYVAPDNVDELLALARANASQDLREELRARRLAKKGDEPVEYRNQGQRLFDRYVKLPAADRGDFDREYRRWNKLPEIKT